MTRLWLAFALLLSLWPSPAVAGPGAPYPGQDSLSSPASSDAHRVLRPDGGLELVRGLHGREGDGRQGPGGAASLPPGDDRPHAVPALHAPRAPEEAAHPCPPLCERLPYDATAPPSAR